MSRSLTRLGWLSMLFVSMALGCSRAVTHPGEGGKGGTGSTVSESSSVSVGGGGGQGGAPPCQVLHLGKLHAYDSAYFEADIVENILGPEKDVLSISFYASPTQSTWSGSQDLGSAENSNFSTCTTCVNVYPDNGQGDVYFQTAGTLNLGSTMVDFNSFDLGLMTDGSISMAHFVEVTVDIPTRISTPVPNGRCFDIPMGALAMTKPPVGWTCQGALYDDDGKCDCNCGVIDQDCTDPSLMIAGCLAGQTCDSTTAKCAGIPSGWTCAPADYNAGAANGCDCNCGVHDPDCDLMPAPMLKGCATGETCNASSKCVPTSWTCTPDSYGEGTANSCDCGCGAKDLDCVLAAKAACDFCDDSGSCNTHPCSDPACTINATNNAICN